MQLQSSLLNNDEIRTQEEVNKEPDICPFASRGFSHDEARYCEIRYDGHGHTCTVFRLKPFDKCPSYFIYLSELEQLALRGEKK
jgi:hypothetical protein